MKKLVVVAVVREYAVQKGIKPQGTVSTKELFKIVGEHVCTSKPK